jgi:hypothetical protein
MSTLFTFNIRTDIFDTLLITSPEFVIQIKLVTISSNLLVEYRGGRRQQSSASFAENINSKKKFLYPN